MNYQKTGVVGNSRQKPLFEVLCSFSKAFALVNGAGEVLESNKAFHQALRQELAPKQSLFELVSDFSPEGENRGCLKHKLEGEDPFIHYISISTSEGSFQFKLEAVPFSVNSVEGNKYVVLLEPFAEKEFDRERLNLLEKVMDVSQDVILIAEAKPIDAESGGPKVLEVNKAFTEMTGYEKEEIIGKIPRILQGEQTDRKELDKIREALKNWEPVQAELINYKKDGTPFWVSISINPISDEQGHFTHWVSMQRNITAQKEHQAKLEEMAEIFQETQGLTKTGAWGIDVRTEELELTDEVYKIFEIPKDYGLTVQNGLTFFHEEDRHIMTRAMERSVKERQSFDDTCRFITAKGNHRYVRVTGKPILVNNRLTKIVGVFQDVTQQYTARENLSVLNDRFSLAVNAAKMGVWEYLPKENVLHWDEKMYDLYGTNKEEFSGAYEAWISALHPDSFKKAQEDLVLALYGKKDFHTEFEILLPDGKRRVIAGEAVVLRDEKGEAERMIGVNFDITDKKDHLDELNLLYKVVESAGDAIIITKPELDKQEILYTNPAHEEMTGYSNSEILGKSPRIFQGPDTSAFDLEKIRTAISAEENIQIELENYKKNGEKFWVNMIITYVRNEENEVTHFVSIQRDVTDRKIAELEMVQAKEAAEKASRAKSEFLSVMSHEIRTPLNAVIGVSGLLDGTPLDGEQRDLVDTIRQGGESLLSILNDILDYSKIEADKIELEEVEFELEKPVEEVIDILSNQAFTKGIELLYQADPTPLVSFMGDIGRIRQILMNLLGNAIKFTDEGEVLLSYKLLSEDDKSCKFEFAVTDTGIGISPEKRVRLFQPFSQVDASISREYGGSGLGLAIVKRLVNKMGGEIWLKSKVGKGSTFFFTISLKKARVSEQKPIPPQQLEGRRILLVDDNSTSLNILENLLREQDYLVSGFHNPKELVQKIEQHQVLQWDLGILDFAMPQMNGLELAYLLKGKSGYEHLPLILLNSGALHPRKEILSVFDFTLQKPVKKEALLNRVQNVLRREKRQEQVPLKTPGVHSEPDLSGYSILLVEDNIMNQNVAKRMLKKFNIEVEVANNGEEAMECIQSRTYDLVLMDIQMPIMDGIEATKQIRKLKEKIQQPVIIAVTANTSVEDRKQCKEAGMDDFISKPITLSAFRKHLLKWLSPKHAIEKI